MAVAASAAVVTVMAAAATIIVAVAIIVVVVVEAVATKNDSGRGAERASKAMATRKKGAEVKVAAEAVEAVAHALSRSIHKRCIF